MSRRDLQSTKSALAELSDPVIATPIQPMAGDRNAKRMSGRGEPAPERDGLSGKFMTNATASKQRTVGMAHLMLLERCAVSLHRLTARNLQERHREQAGDAEKRGGTPAAMAVTADVPIAPRSD